MRSVRTQRLLCAFDGTNRELIFVIKHANIIFSYNIFSLRVKCWQRQWCGLFRHRVHFDGWTLIIIGKYNGDFVKASCIMNGNDKL